MNRQEWEEQTFSSDMNPTARCVALVIGSHGNWTKTKEVRPSVKRIAGMTGLSRATAGKYVDAFEEQGWLKYIRTTKNNVRVYELMHQDVEPLDILAKTKRGKKFSKEHQPPRQVVESLDMRLSNHST